MLAKCAKCQYVFQADRFGQVSCPVCGATLMLSPPEGTPPPPSGQPAGEPPGEPPTPPEAATPGEVPPAGALPPAGPPPPGGAMPPPPPPSGGEQDQRTPWEERETRGAFPALVETAKRSLFDPSGFFGRMRVDNADGVLSYFWLIWVAMTLVSALWQLALGNLGMTLARNLPWAEGQDYSQYFSQTAGQISTTLISAALGPVVLYLQAGITHLFAMLFRAADRGFNATLRAIGYSAAPLLLVVVPGCGGFIGLLWWTVLIILGLSKTQRTSGGASAAAVLLPTVILFCCCFGLIGSLMAAVISLGNFNIQ